MLEGKISVKEAMEISGISRVRICEHCRLGTFDCLMWGGRWVIDRKSFMEWLESEGRIKYLR